MRLNPTDAEVLEYLDELRASGVTNMYGAGAYLEREFGFDRREAGQRLADWMRTFTERRKRGEVQA
jgi:hypothetical protein